MMTRLSKPVREEREAIEGRRPVLELSALVMSFDSLIRTREEGRPPTSLVRVKVRCRTRVSRERRRERRTYEIPARVAESAEDATVANGKAELGSRGSDRLAQGKVEHLHSIASSAPARLCFSPRKGPHHFVLSRVVAKVDDLAHKEIGRAHV